MNDPSVASMPEPTTSSVRAQLLDTLRRYASEGSGDPLSVGWLFLRVCHTLAQEGVIPSGPDRDQADEFERLEYACHTDGFPDFAVSPEVADYVWQLIWELYLQGILAPTPGSRKVSSKTHAESDLIPIAFLVDLDRVTLTHYGVSILSDTTNRIQVHDRDGYLGNFQNADPPPDAEMMRYLGECVSVFRGGHFLATVVLLGIASERLIEVLAESLRDALGDPTGKEWFDKRYRNKRDISARFKALSAKLMGEYGDELNREKLKDAFNGVVTLTFEQIRNARNDIAHPSGREFTWNEVSGLLHNFVQYFIYTNRIIAFLRSKQKNG